MKVNIWASARTFGILLLAATSYMNITTANAATLKGAQSGFSAKLDQIRVGRLSFDRATKLQWFKDHSMFSGTMHLSTMNLADELATASQNPVAFGVELYAYEKADPSKRPGFFAKFTRDFIRKKSQFRMYLRTVNGKLNVIVEGLRPTDHDKESGVQAGSIEDLNQMLNVMTTDLSKMFGSEFNVTRQSKPLGVVKVESALFSGEILENSTTPYPTMRLTIHTLAHSPDAMQVFLLALSAAVQ